MKLKTKQQLKDEGFKFVASNENTGMEVWARFTGWQDYIQYIDYKEGVYAGDVQTISFSRTCLMKHMAETMIHEYIEKGIENKMEDKPAKWNNENGDCFYIGH